MINNRGIFLIQTAFVLVIIGFILFLVGSGRDLLDESKIQKLSIEFTKYETVINAFTKQYGNLPGDLNGNLYWDCSDVTPGGTCNVSSSTLGNGLLDFTTKGPFVWVHLRKAGFLEGSLNMSDANTFYPESVFSGAFFRIDRATAYVNNANSNFIALAFPSVNSSLTPALAYSLDSKFDDGQPATGKIIILRGSEFASNNTACVDQHHSTATTNVKYLTEDDKRSCRAWWRISN